MRKPPTGEPYAGKPPVRFGGRGGPNPSRPLSAEYARRRLGVRVSLQRGKEVLPARVLALDQVDLPLPTPLLKRFFPLDRVLDLVERLKVHELVDAVLLGEAGNNTFAV